MGFGLLAADSGVACPVLVAAAPGGPARLLVRAAGEG